jgi:iron complex outermembrane recepter protein
MSVANRRLRHRAPSLPSFRHTLLATALGALLHQGPAGAQSAETPVELAPVEVEASRPDESPAEPGRPRTVLRDDALRDRRGSTLGETIGDEAGVHNASFGSGVGLPVIRGLSGARVKVLSNGGGTHDASAFSPDHASTADTTLADSVRILRGPATIRYGGGAIGGVVDVDDGRIPTRVPAHPLGGMLDTRYNRNGAGRVTALRLDGGNARLAVHASASSHSRSDSHIAGCAVDDAAVFAQFGQINARNSCGRLYNSDARGAAGTLGGNLFLDTLAIGVAINESSSRYGIPPAPGHSHGGDDRVRIDMDNRRVDTRVEWLGEGWLQALRYTGAHVAYRHDEIEHGAVATTFRNDAVEQRLEAEHRVGTHLSGTVGAHAVRRDFSALGVESFVPLTALDSAALYATQRIGWSAFSLELGWRAERTRMRAAEHRTVLGADIVYPARTLHTGSRSAALSWQATRALKISLTRSHAERPPEIHELYSTGPHLSTRTFDIGKPDLATETMRGTDFSVEYENDAVRATVTQFSNDIEGYIHQRTLPLFFDTDSQQIIFACVRLEECLPIVQYAQGDARMHGYEAELALKWRTSRAGDVEWSVFADEVSGRLTQLREDIPRLPAARLGTQLSFSTPAWNGRVRVTRHADQNRPGANETPTAGHTRVDANLTHRRALGTTRTLTLYLRARNLLDAQARNATSFLRTFSPEPGRSVEAGVSLTF